MSSFGRTASPVLTMPPPTAHTATLDRSLFAHQSSSFGHSASWSQSSSSRIPRGRKRSRDEAAVNLDPPEKAAPAVEPVHEDEDEWEYGPGMILIKKSTGYVHDATSQSGTWLEEKAAEEEARRTEDALLAQQRQAQDRPSLRSHKSSRLDITANLSPHDAAQANRSSPGRDIADSPTSIPSMAPETIAQPVVDDFTLHLGIGWSRLSDDEHIQAAARGWARYIENHFPVTEPKIRLESKGLESYLVEANEGYFLFAENLHQGRLVSKDAQRTLNNLKTSPPTFEGVDVMAAAESPRPADTEIVTTTADIPPHSHMDMDMS